MIKAVFLDFYGTLVREFLMHFIKLTDDTALIIFNSVKPQKNTPLSITRYITPEIRISLRNIELFQLERE